MHPLEINPSCLIIIEHVHLPQISNMNAVYVALTLNNLNINDLTYSNTMHWSNNMH